MSLANLFLEAKIQATDTGDDRPLDLSGGARLVVRVRDNVVTLTISRPKKKLSDTELITFRRDCGVPSDAARYPTEGQGQRGVDGETAFYVAYRWAEGASE